MKEPVTVRLGPGGFIRAFENLNGHVHICLAVFKEDVLPLLAALGLTSIEPRDHVPLTSHNGTFTLE